ncbi:MAG TPA: hypothetical protein VNZ52_03245 [Candidatus Thermoplasmatota archaeon]|nr:hypothetical protein [Candidatus Thermoplasmatota archaeon]
MQRTAALLLSLGLLAVGLAGCLESGTPRTPIPRSGPGVDGDEANNTTTIPNGTAVPHRHVQVNATLEDLEKVRGGTYVITTFGEWRDLWGAGDEERAPEAPIDFSKERLVAAFVGHGGDSCLQIDILNVTQADNVTYVEVFTQRPSGTEICAEYYHVPSDFVPLPRDGTRIEVVERGEMPYADPASPIQFAMEPSYPQGGSIAVKVKNTGNETYQYNEMYAACDLKYFTDAGRQFKIPPGTHCDLVVMRPLPPGATVTLFTWNATECTKDLWGCAESKLLPPGTYHIRGIFTGEAREGPRGEYGVPTAYAGTTFRIQ